MALMTIPLLIMLAQAAPAAPAPATALEELAVTAEEPRFVAPTRHDRIGRIWAPVHINGQGPFRLVLDTGASHSALTPRLAETLGIPLDSGHTVMLRGATGSLPVPMVPVETLEVGDLLTLEGGIGRSFLHGAASIGVAYYAQWKTTSDDLGLSSTVPALSGIPERHRVFGIGPDVTIPIATKTRLISLVNVRYLWEQGARLKTQGQTLMITNTIPIGKKIPGRHE